MPAAAGSEDFNLSALDTFDPEPPPPPRLDSILCTFEGSKGGMSCYMHAVKSCVGARYGRHENKLNFIETRLCELVRPLLNYRLRDQACFIMFCIESSLAWLEFFDGWLAWFERASGVGVIGFGIY